MNGTLWQVVVVGVVVVEVVVVEVVAVVVVVVVVVVYFFKILVLSWCCSVVLDCTLLRSFVLHFNISPNDLYFHVNEHVKTLVKNTH